MARPPDYAGLATVLSPCVFVFLKFRFFADTLILSFQTVAVFIGAPREVVESDRTVLLVILCLDEL